MVGNVEPELGAELKVIVNAEDTDSFLDTLIDFAEERGLRIGGGIGPEPIDSEYNGTFVVELATVVEDDALTGHSELERWLAQNEAVRRFVLGGLLDLNE